MTKSFFIAVTAALVVVAQASSAYAAGAQCDSKFGENVLQPVTETCSKAINNLGYVSPNLKSCYRNSGLYFSTPDTVCSPNCFNATVEASKKLAEACPVPDNQTIATQADVYKKWSCADAATAACSKNTQGKYCLQAIASTLVTAENIKLNVERVLAGKDLRKELDCDGPCAKKLYDSLKGEGKNAPVLYFFGYNGLDSLFAAYEKVCGFKKPTNGTSNATTSTPVPAPAPDTTETTPVPATPATPAASAAPATTAAPAVPAVPATAAVPAAPATDSYS